MNIRTQMAFFDKRNPLNIHRHINNQQRPGAPDKKYKNDLKVNYHNISSKILDIPDIFSHSIEKEKKDNIPSYKKITKFKETKSLEKIIDNSKIKDRKDFLNCPINNNFSLSNINYYPNMRNKKNSIVNSISMDNDINNNATHILKDMKRNNYQIRKININKTKNNNISTSLPKIKIKLNPLNKLTKDSDKEKGKEKEKNKIEEDKEKRTVSQRAIHKNLHSVSNKRSKIILKINHNYKPVVLEEILGESHPFYQPAKHSENAFDKIISYGVNTYRGTIRAYNEDRVTILINATINKTNNINNNFYKISLFSIYDGHAGSRCCEYLKAYLHHYIFDSEFFPQNPIKAIEQGFKNCENNFLNSINGQDMVLDSSGSCAIIVLIMNDSCYIANLGDSRALYSFESGKKFFQLTRDHKPNDPIEKKRIYKAGGNVYKTNIQQMSENSLIGFRYKESLANIPYRIFPGRLSVSYFLIL